MFRQERKGIGSLSGSAATLKAEGRGNNRKDHRSGLARRLGENWNDAGGSASAKPGTQENDV